MHNYYIVIWIDWKYICFRYFFKRSSPANEAAQWITSRSLVGISSMDTHWRGGSAVGQTMRQGHHLCCGRYLPMICVSLYTGYFNFILRFIRNLCEVGFSSKISDNITYVWQKWYNTKLINNDLNLSPWDDGLSMTGISSM